MDPINSPHDKFFHAVFSDEEHARTQLRLHFEEILRAVSSQPMEERYRSFLKVFLEYLLQVGGDTPRSFVEEEIEKVSDEDTREVYMTIAEQLRAEEKQQVLVRLLEKKFSPLDAAVKQKIRSC